MIPDTLLDFDMIAGKEALFDSVLFENNQLKSIVHRQRATENMTSVAKKEGQPSFGLGLNYIITGKRNDVEIPNNGTDAILPVLSVRIPLYRSKYRGKTAEAEFTLEALHNLEADHKNRLQIKLESAWVDYKDADRRIQLYNEQNNRAGQALSVLIETYTTAGKDFEEILRMQQMILHFDLEVIRAIKDKNTAIALVESLY